MKTQRQFCLVALTLGWLLFGLEADAQPSSRSRILLDSGWKFHLRDISGIDPYTDGGGVIGTTNYDDSGWVAVNLPHDYVIQGVFNAYVSMDHGYLPLNPAWYRRSFTVPAGSLGKSVWLDFDGIYRDAVVNVNGHFITRHASGYIGFHCDITPHINYEGENVVAVHVDPTRHEGWFYEGGGIYRHVWLNIADPVHVIPSGVYVTSSVKDGVATVKVITTVTNAATSSQVFTVVSSIYDKQSNLVASVTTPAQTSAPGVPMNITQSLTIAGPRLWSLTDPYLYQLQTTVQHGESNDIVTNSFGVRTIAFDVNTGFYLNGKPVKLKGTANHQDFFGVGVGLTDSLFEYRIRQLQAIGCNALRTAHNPVAPELLDACDRLGMLVMDENRHLGDTYYPKADANTPCTDLTDLKDMIRRDRNHPSVIMWSLCNEEPLQSTAAGETMIQTMKTVVRGLDLTRPATAAQHDGFGGPGFANVMNLIGINYLPGSYDSIHATYSNRIVFGSEIASALTTRGKYAMDSTNSWVSSYDSNFVGLATSVQDAWQAVDTRPFIAGGFVWTGFDYMGEPTPYKWPAVSSQFGIMDRCGFPKDSYYYFKAAWGNQPIVHVFPHWNWTNGQKVIVWVYSNCPRVELLLNGQSLGVKSVPRNRHAEWEVPFAPGTLVARGSDAAGVIIAEDRVQTTGAPARLAVSTDRLVLKNDGQDTAVVKVQVLDAAGLVVPTATNLVSFSVSGPGHLAGVGNGNPGSHEPEQAAQRFAFGGLCAALLQTDRGGSGDVTLTASVPGLAPASLTLSVGPGIGSAPAAPANLVAKLGNGKVTLTWDACAGATSYNVKRSTNGAAGCVTITDCGTVTSAQYIDPDVASATYTYLVSAVNPAGESSNSAPATVRPVLRWQLNAGHFLVLATASQGQRGVLETSTNLAQWWGVLTNTALSDGDLEFNDGINNGQGCRFYRVRME